MLEGRNEIRDGGHHCANYGEVSCVVQLSNFIRRLSRIQTESLGSHTDIENWRPATRAGNWPDVGQNPENRDSEIPQRLANSRECRANFFEPDIACRDGTGWLRMQSVANRSPPADSLQFAILQGDFQIMQGEPILIPSNFLMLSIY
jgi:hypothetical protein